MQTKDNFFYRKTTLNCRGKILDLSQPQVMGILNITPDSFYDGNKYKHMNEIQGQMEKMMEEGAAIIDIGAYSSRPGATDISPAEEWRRLEPVLTLILQKYDDFIFSIDTFRSEIARQAISNFPVSLINDISAGELDNEMFDTMATENIPYIMMHMKGNPQNMKSKAQYQDILNEITDYFAEKTERLKQMGLKDMVIDPGFGFSKAIDQNFELLGLVNNFKIFGFPILAGLSRKSMIYKTLNISPGEALNGTTVLNTIALMQGINILRVHDVREARETIQLYEKYSAFLQTDKS